MAGKKSAAKKQYEKPVLEKAEAPAPPVPPALHRVIVQGFAPRMQRFNLPHEVYCAEMGECSCRMMDVAVTVYSRVENGREPRMMKKKKRVNSTLTVRHRQRVAVPRAALSCPEVKAALDAKWLRVSS